MRRLLAIALLALAASAIGATVAAVSGREAPVKGSPRRSSWRGTWRVALLCGMQHWRQCLHRLHP